MAQTLGAQLLPFRDQVEKWAAELGQEPWPGDKGSVQSHAALSQEPGVYLRLRIENASDGKKLRSAAARSLRDGFTSCFFEHQGFDPRVGPECRVQADCESGLLCNEWDVCTKAPQPYNLRLAFRSLRVLSNEWSDEVNQAGSELALRIYDRDLERTTREDVPIAAEVLAKAHYLTMVLDEDPADGLPPALDAGPDDPDETEEERVQRVGHFARVGVWDLKAQKQVLAYRIRAEGKFIPVGEREVKEPRTVAAQARQTNSCALALSVKRQMDVDHAKSSKPAAPVEAEPAGEPKAP